LPALPDEPPELTDDALALALLSPIEKLPEDAKATVTAAP
jgi:hypothetical protein